MNELTKEMLNMVKFLQKYIKEVDSLTSYCKNVIRSLEVSNEYHGEGDYIYCYNNALIGVYRGVLNVWYENKSLSCCVSYLKDVEGMIKSGELVYEC